MCRWLENNLPNLIPPLHRFCVHTLTTVYRTIETGPAGVSVIQEPSLPQSDGSPDNPLTRLSEDMRNRKIAGNKNEVITGNTLPTSGGKGSLMPLSQSWLLAAALPTTFTRLQAPKVQPPPPQAEKPEVPETPTVNVSSLSLDPTPARKY